MNSIGLWCLPGESLTEFSSLQISYFQTEIKPDRENKNQRKQNNWPKILVFNQLDKWTEYNYCKRLRQRTKHRKVEYSGKISNSKSNGRELHLQLFLTRSIPLKLLLKENYGWKSNNGKHQSWSWLHFTISLKKFRRDTNCKPTKRFAIDVSILLFQKN